MVDRHEMEESVFKNHWLTKYQSSGRGYEFYEPAYRFGYELAREEARHSRGWDAFEADAKRRWAGRFPNIDWSEVRDAVQHAWESAHRDREAVEQDVLDKTVGDKGADGDS